MIKKLIPAVMACIMIGALGVQAEDSDAEIPSSVLAVQNKQFVEVMGGPIMFADAFGSREKGPHGTFGLFPGNFETPLHTHSHAYVAVVIKGQMTNPFKGEKNPPMMGPGSFWSVAAGEEHSTACVSEEPCEFFMTGEHNFDFMPVK